MSSPRPPGRRAGRLVSDNLWHAIGGYAFHLGLFAVLLFAAPHVRFFDHHVLSPLLPASWMVIDWPELPRWGFIIAADFAFAGLIVLLVRRFSDPVLRKTSDRDDHLSSWLTFLVMLTGCLAMQQAHDSLRAIHMLCVDIWLIYFPFSRLMHAFTFFLSRQEAGGEYGRTGMAP